MRAIFRVEGDTADRVINFPFAGIGKNDAIYARGTLADADLRKAIEARDGKLTTELPQGLDLKYGESALFEDKTATAENGKPQFYGYLNDGSQVVRFSAWKKANGHFGEAKIWTPRAESPDADAARRNATTRAAGRPTEDRNDKI